MICPCFLHSLRPPSNHLEIMIFSRTFTLHRTRKVFSLPPLRAFCFQLAQQSLLACQSSAQ